MLSACSSMIYFYSQCIIPTPFLRWRKHSRTNICGHRASAAFCVCLLSSKLPGDSGRRVSKRGSRAELIWLCHLDLTQRLWHAYFTEISQNHNVFSVVMIHKEMQNAFYYFLLLLILVRSQIIWFILFFSYFSNNYYYWTLKPHAWFYYFYYKNY